MIIFPALSQSATPGISCDQTADIDQFKASLTSYANELNIQNIDQLNKYLDGQVIEETSTKVSIRSSLIPAKKYVELSKAYGVNIAKHDYYELFTSQFFCQRVEQLESVDSSAALAAANTQIQKKLIEKLIAPYSSQTLKAVTNTNSGSVREAKKTNKLLKINPMIPLMPIVPLMAQPPSNEIQKWEAGVSTSTYNTATYNTVRASEDWTDLNNNFEGEDWHANRLLASDFREWNAPVHPYETLGVDDAYAYGFTGKGQTIAIHDGEFCAIPHEEFSRMNNEGRLTAYPRDGSNWAGCSSSNRHGMTVSGYAAADFQNDSTNFEDTIMGVAYNANLHWASNWGNNGYYWNPSKWALNIDDAKASGAVVQNNSWGFDDDLNPDVVKNYMDENNKTLAEALVHFQGIKTEGLTGEDWYDIGIQSVEQNWTTDDWNTFFDSINSFQETGVYVNAGSNDNFGNMGIVNCTASEKDGGGNINQNKQCHANPTKTIDTSGGLPYLLPSLRDAWIQVVNVASWGFADASSDGHMMWSAPCGQMAEWCVSADAVHVPGVKQITSVGQTGLDVYSTLGYGTSYAAPMVSGAVAIMAEAFPNLTPAEWSQRLFATANNSWFDYNRCFDWSNVTDASLVTKWDVGVGGVPGDNWGGSCGGIDGSVSYGDGVSHEYNRIYGHGFPDLKKALEPIKYKRIRVRDTQYALAASTILLSGLTYQNFFFDGAQGQFHDALYTGFDFKMDDLVKQPVRSHSRRLNSFDNSSRKQWIDSIGGKSTDLQYAVSYTDEEDVFDPDANKSSPEIASLSFSISNDKNTATNVSYKMSSGSLLGFDIGERPLQNFLANGVQQSYLPFTVAIDRGYSVGQHHLLNDQNKLSYTFYQGEHSYTEKMESGILLNFSSFDLENDSYLNAYTGYNLEDTTFLRNQTSGAFGETNAQTYHTGFSYENHIMNDLYFGSNLNLGYTETTVSEDALISSVDPLITSQYVIGFVEKNIINKKDSLSFNLSQPLSIESGSSTIKIPYYLNKSSNGFTEREIDLSAKDRFNKLNLDYIYSFSDHNQLHAGVTVGATNFSEFNSPSFMVNYKLIF